MENREKVYRVTALVVIIDQIVKLLINHFMKENQIIKIIPRFFSLFYVKNTGAAFSILKDNTILIMIISAAFIVIINDYIKKEKNLSKNSIFAFGLILGGVFGNLLDRAIYHAVIDYLSFTFFHYDFPVFNIADICITVGVAFLIIEMINEKRMVNSEGVIRESNQGSKRRKSSS